jgi:hypothetical protein
MREYVRNVVLRIAVEALRIVRLERGRVCDENIRLDFAGLKYVLREYAQDDEQYPVRSSVENESYPCWADF